MPIPGPYIPTPADAGEMPRTGSPFWLRLNGSWVQLEGVVPGVGVASDRPSSDFRSLDGNRYAQRAALARREWSLSYQYATPGAVGALMAASESDGDVWLWSDGTVNMLARDFCTGTGEVVDCGGVPLRAFHYRSGMRVPVRVGVPMTLSAWATGAGQIAEVDFGDPVVLLTAVAPGRVSVTFTPTVDEFALLHFGEFGPAASGLMLTEGTTAPDFFAHGEAMPCTVAVGELGDTMTMHHGGHYRHEYSVAVREVG